MVQKRVRKADFSLTKAEKAEIRALAGLAGLSLREIVRRIRALDDEQVNHLPVGAA